MKAQEFKRLIREAVRDVVRDEIREAIREELVEVLAENLRPKGRSLRESLALPSSPIMSSVNPEERTEARSKLRDLYESQVGGLSSPPKVNLRSSPIVQAVAAEPTIASNPYADFLLDTAANLTPQDIVGLKNIGNS